MEGDIGLEGDESSFEILPSIEDEEFLEVPPKIRDDDKSFSSIKKISRTPDIEDDSPHYLENDKEDIGSTRITNLNNSHNSNSNECIYTHFSNLNMKSNPKYMGIEKNEEQLEIVTINSEKIKLFSDSTKFDLFENDPFPMSIKKKLRPSMLPTTTVVPVTYQENKISSDSQGTFIKQNTFPCERNGIQSETVLTCETVQHNSHSYCSDIIQEEIPESNKLLLPCSCIAEQTRRYLGSNNCGRKFLKMTQHISEWFRSQNLFQNIFNRSKTYVNMLRSALELEIVQNNGREKLLHFAIVSEGSHDSAIKEAFTNVFGNHVAFSSIHVHSFLDLVPVIPIGHIAALNSVETKVTYVREHALSRQNDVVMSTSSFLFQAIPQRWQLTTILHLYDPRLDLSLHNFTVTTPIPNTYVSAAEQKTPLNYIHRECGLGVRIEDAISDVTNLGSKSIQEFLSDYNHNRAIKSAAFVLASMYKKYVNVQ